MLTSAHRQPVRQLALHILCRVDRAGAFADHLVTSLTAAHALTPQERAFLRELTYGVLRWRNRLDWLLGECSTRPLEGLSPEVRNILRLGAYQLCLMGRIPPHAAVSETVQLAKPVGHAGIVAYVNAVLRSLARRRSALALPTPEVDVVSYLTITESHPRWLVDRWLTRHGCQRTIAMCRANNLQPPLVVRTNTRRTTREGLIEALIAEGCTVERCPFAPDGVVILSHPPLDRLRWHHEGWFTVQDEAAVLCGYLLAPQPHERVLDACAAPGGKATHAAELMGDRGEVVCLDRNPHRLRRVQAHCQRLGLTSIRCCVADASEVAFERPFDRILVDAPCSGLGVLRRHPDAKWRKGPELIEAMQRQQANILEHVSGFLKPAGTLLYVTCSTEAEENQHVIHAFLSRHPEYQLDAAAPYLPMAARIFALPQGWFQTWPGPEGLDGFFAARLRRSA